MTLDYSKKRAVKVDMIDYVKKMITEFPEERMKGAKVGNPALETLFMVDPQSPKLDQEDAELFHSTTLKGLFLAKRGRPDVLQPIAYLCTRTKKPTEKDMNKLVWTLKFLKQTSKD